jgi:hypothetical protein
MITDVKHLSMFHKYALPLTLKPIGNQSLISQPGFLNLKILREHEFTFLLHYATIISSHTAISNKEFIFLT